TPPGREWLMHLRGALRREAGCVLTLGRGDERRTRFVPCATVTTTIRENGARWLAEGWELLCVSTPETIYADLHGRTGQGHSTEAHAASVAGFSQLVRSARKVADRGSHRLER